MANLETLAAVHTHTHTHTSISLLNNKQGLEVALFVVASKIYNVIAKVNSNEDNEYVTLGNGCVKNKCLKRRDLKNKLCF